MPLQWRKMKCQFSNPSPHNITTPTLLLNLQAEKNFDPFTTVNSKMKNDPSGNEKRYTKPRFT